MWSLGTDFHISTGPKWKKGHKLRHCGLLGVLKILLALSYQGRSPMFLKYISSKISYLCILGQKCNSPHSLCLHVVYSIYYFLGFSKYIYLFFKSFLLKLFTILYVTFLTSEIKFATYKDATIKMYCLWRTFATFSIFSHAMQCLHICIKCGKTGRQNKLKMLLPSN